MPELELIQDEELDQISGGWYHRPPTISVNLSTTNNLSNNTLNAQTGGTIVIGGAFTAASFS